MATRKSPASAEKKTTTRKAPTKKVAASSALEQAAGPAAHQTSNPTPQKHLPSYEEIAQLSHHFWVERGRPYGSPEVDWLRAEATLHA